jgi:hypothetical protein
MKKLALLLVVFVAILAVCALSFGGAMAGKYMGYLSDVACGTSATGKAGDGTNMKTEPEKHSVACMVAAPCAASGYGLLINEGTASAKKYVFYKFDKKGSDLAAKLLKDTKKKDNMSVEVAGMKEKDTIKVTSITEK